MKKNFPRILVSPLDWGIGHATRCVPVIRALREHGAEVILGADGKGYDFLENYFPELECIRIPGVSVRYPSSERMALKMAPQVPNILAGIRKEHHLLKKIIADRKIDAVISDNRFGMWSDQVYSVYITHQVRIKAPEGWAFAEPLLAGIHRHFIEKYRECWIPDFAGEPNLSGNLSHPPKLPPGCRYVGPLSRFPFSAGNFKQVKGHETAELLILLSGPEPQRSIFEKIILGQLEDQRQMKAIILQGLPGKFIQTNPLPNVTTFSHLPDEELANHIRCSGRIICRPGYSTLMDLASLGRGAVLVPTPGQTEQEYLARHHANGKSFFCISQSEFTIEKAWDHANRLVRPDYSHQYNDLLGSIIGKMIERLQSKI